MIIYKRNWSRRFTGRCVEVAFVPAVKRRRGVEGEKFKHHDSLVDPETVKCFFHVPMFKSFHGITSF